jgi:hypothetical protein
MGRSSSIPFALEMSEIVTAWRYTHSAVVNLANLGRFELAAGQNHIHNICIIHTLYWRGPGVFKFNGASDVVKVLP